MLVSVTCSCVLSVCAVHYASHAVLKAMLRMPACVLDMCEFTHALMCLIYNAVLAYLVAALSPNMDIANALLPTCKSYGDRKCAICCVSRGCCNVSCAVRFM